MIPIPEEASIDDLVVRRWRAADVVALHEAILANLEHLRPRMTWIAEEPMTLAERRAKIEGWTATWAAGGDLMAGIWRDGQVVGSAGLHHRGWPDGREIGFWVDGASQGQGIATRASRALTDLAFTTDDDACYLAHDRTNLASRRVPEKLGYLDIGEEAVTDPAKIAPADCGVHGRWRMTRAEWQDRV